MSEQHKDFAKLPKSGKESSKSHPSERRRMIKAAVAAVPVILTVGARRANAQGAYGYIS